MSHASLAADIGDLIGGPGNVNQVHTCATRLRFQVKDGSKVRKDQINALRGVLQVVEQGGQTQVVIGPQVGEVYTALTKLPGWSAVTGDSAGSGDNAGAKVGVINRIFDVLAGTFQPLMWPLVGASMIKMLLGLAGQFGWYDTAAPSPMMLVLTAASNSVFYFLPVLVGITSARKLGANPFLAGAIAAALLEPSFVAIGTTGDIASFLGMPLYVFAYASSVFPAILASLALSYLERGLKKIVHKNLQLVIIPTVALLVLVPLTALVFGPFGVLFGQAVADFVTWLSAISPILLAVAFAGSFMFLVMLGLHWALLPIMLVNLGNLGADPLLAAMGAYNFAVWGLAVGVFIKAKRDPELRELAGAGAAAGLLAGISEPMLYGVILRFKRVIPIVLCGAIAGGVVIGLFNVRATAFAFSSIFTIPLMQPTLGYIIAIAVAFAIGLGGVLMFGYESKRTETVSGDADTDPAKIPAPAASFAAPIPALGGAPFTVNSPIAGVVMPLTEVPDAVFAGGLVGPGVGIVPSEGIVVAPADGTVIVAPPTGHAVGMRTTDGAEILIHVGIDTVQMAGEGFRPLVHTGQQVTAGQRLLEFDLAAIETAGFSAVTPVLVTNAFAYGSVEPTATNGTVAAGSPLLTVQPAAEAASQGR